MNLFCGSQRKLTYLRKISPFAQFNAKEFDFVHLKWKNGSLGCKNTFICSALPFAKTDILNL